MDASNAQTMAAKGRELSFFLIPAAVLAAFALMFTGVIASLNHQQELTASIETVIAGPSAPEQPEQSEQATGIAVANAQR